MREANKHRFNGIYAPTGAIRAHRQMPSNMILTQFRCLSPHGTRSRLGREMTRLSIIEECLHSLMGARRSIFDHEKLFSARREHSQRHLSRHSRVVIGCKGNIFNYIKGWRHDGCFSTNNSRRWVEKAVRDFWKICHARPFSCWVRAERLLSKVSCPQNSAD